MIKTSLTFTAFSVMMMVVLFLSANAVVRASNGADDGNPCVPIYGQGCPTPTPSPTPSPTPTVSPAPTPTPAVTPTPVPTPMPVVLAPQAQAQAQAQSQSQAIVVNVPQGAPAQPEVAGVATVAGIKELPKTGLPQAAMAFTGLSVPMGFLLRRFAASKTDEKIKDHAGYIWQVREFMKGGER